MNLVCRKKCPDKRDSNSDNGEPSPYPEWLHYSREERLSTIWLCVSQRKFKINTYAIYRYRIDTE